MATATDTAPETIYDLGQDPDFPNLPLTDRIERFNKAAKTDINYQKMSDKGKNFKFQQIFGNASPSEQSATPEQTESFNRASTQAQALREPTTTNPSYVDPNVRQFFPEVAKAAGKGVVKGIQDLASIPGMLVENVAGPPDAQGKPTYPLADVGHTLQSTAKMPEDLLTGDKGFEASPPGYASVEHLVKASVGAASTALAMSKIFPLLQAGVSLTDQVISMIKLAVRGALAGEGVKAVGGSPWMEVTAELVAGGLTVKDVRALYQKLQDNPRVLRFISKSAQRQPGYAANVTEGRNIEELTGAKLSTPELSRDPTAAAGYQYLKQNDPTFHTLATTAEQQKLDALGTATSRALQGAKPGKILPPFVSGAGGVPTTSEDILQGVVDIAKAPVRTARADVTSAEADLQAASAAKRSADAQALMHQSDAFATRVVAEDKMLGDLKSIQQRQYDLKDVDTTFNQQAAQELRDLRVQKTQILNDAQDTMLTDLNNLDKRRAEAHISAQKGNANAVNDLYNIKIEHRDILDSHKQRLRLQLDDLQKQRYDFEDAARLGDQKATARLQEIDVERTKLLKDADDVFQGITQKARSYNKLLTKTERDLEDELARTTALNQQDTARAQGVASFDAMKIAPEGTTPGTALALQKLRARKQQLTAALEKGDTAAQSELDVVLAQETQLKAGNATPERNLAALPPGVRAQTGFEAITEQGSTGSTFQQTVAQRTEAVAKQKYGNFYRQFNELDTQAQPFLDSLDALEHRVIGRTQESYIPDPTINDIKQTIFQKAKTEEYKALKAGTLLDENDVVKQLPHTNGVPQSLESFLAEKAPVNEKIMQNLRLNIEEMHGFRSRVLTERRNMPADSPRRSVLQGLSNVANEAMEDIARQSPEAYRMLRGGVDPATGKTVMGLDPWYAREIQRGTADPGHYILQRDPATGQLLHPLDVVADVLFSQGPVVGKPSAAASANLQNFNTHMKNIDETIAEGYIRQDYDLVAQAREAKKAVLDTARTKFYIAAHDPITGAYLPDKAQQWVQDYGTVIQSNPDLVAIFKNQQTRLNAIREVDAITEGRVADLQEYQAQLRRARQTGTQEGGEAIFNARGERRQARQDANVNAQTQQEGLNTSEIARKEQEVQQGRQLTADTSGVRQDFGAANRAEQRRFTDEQYRLVTEKIARGDALSGVEQVIADEARTVRGTMRQTRRDVTETDITTRQRLAEEKIAHGGFVTGEERRLAAEARATRENMRDTRRSLDKIRLEDRRLSAMYTESERVASENLKVKNAAYDSAIEEYKTTFQGRQAALESLKDNIATQQLGATPRDIITEIETMPTTARNRAYMKMLHNSGNDPAVRDTLLKYMWEESLQKTGTKATNLEREVLLPNAETAAQFIADREELLRKIAPEYLADLKTIQAGFERVAALEKPPGMTPPSNITRMPVEKRGKIDFGVGVLFGMVGLPFGAKIPYEAGMAYVTSDLLIRRYDARKIAALRDIYLNPEKAREAAQLFATETAPAMRRAIATRLLSHTPSAVGAAQESTTP